MRSKTLSAIVLAAGQGTRMRSARPKPVHRLVGRPLVRHVLDALADCYVERVVVVVGHEAEAVTKKLHEIPGSLQIELVEQSSQRGTGDAVAVGLTGLPDDDLDPSNPEDGEVMVLPGDTPLVRPSTLARLAAEHHSAEAACTVLTARVDDPTGYGRVVRDQDGRVLRIVEERDATEDERGIDEINTSIYVFRRSLLAPALRRLTPENVQGELYLTDVVEVLADAGHRVIGVEAEDPDEIHGVNDRVQLAAAEAELRSRINQSWMRAGVTIVDPTTTYIDADVQLGHDITLWPDTHLRGHTSIGTGSDIGPGAELADCTVGQDTKVMRTVAEGAVIGDHAVVGPYAVLGAGSEISAGGRTGPFYTASMP